jgi:glycine betaine/choline ABC-type transport system substrate-binding protein
MKKVYIDRKLCIGPNFSTAEFVLIKRDLAEQEGLSTLSDLLGVAGNIQRLTLKEALLLAIALRRMNRRQGLNASRSSFWSERSPV